MLIGQTELKKYIDSSSAACFPKTILFIGPKGCGKHSFASYVSH
jgi:SpoVK/Ycf46/Vps4 family AAA+-type ATPase